MSLHKASPSGVSLPAGAGAGTLALPPAGASPGPGSSGAVLVSRERLVAPPDRLIPASDSRLLDALQGAQGAREPGRHASS